MTDKERFIQLMESFGLFLKEEVYPLVEGESIDGRSLTRVGDLCIPGIAKGTPQGDGIIAVDIRVEQFNSNGGDEPNPKVATTYYTFGNSYYFDAEGKFLAVDFAT